MSASPRPRTRPAASGRPSARWRSWARAESRPDRRQDRPTPSPRVTSSSSSCSNASGIASAAPPAASRASFEEWSSCRTTSVLPPLSSNVTVVTGPPSPPSSFVHTRREGGVTSRYVPKNAMPSGSNSRRYLPPTRTSISQERRAMPIDFGIRHRLKSSGLVHASNTMRAGPSTVRLTTSSRSDFRSTVVRFFIGAPSPSPLASIGNLLPFQFVDDLVQLVEARGPEPPVPLHPCRLFLQPARAERARPHASDLPCGDEPRLLQHADVLLHAREGHVEPVGQVRDRGVRPSQLLQDAAPGDVRERGKRGIEARRRILNHMVQYTRADGRRQEGAGGLARSRPTGEPAGPEARLLPSRSRGRRASCRPAVTDRRRGRPSATSGRGRPRGRGRERSRCGSRG